MMGPEGAACCAHGMHMVKARVGHHLAPILLSSGRNIFEELGSEFTLVAFGADDASVSAFKNQASVAKVPLKIVRDSDDDGREKYETRLILVRPDQYVVWTGDRAPSDTSSLMRRITGCVQSRCRGYGFNSREN